MSREKATSVGFWVWVCRTRWRRPERANQRRPSASQPAVATSRPFGENAALTSPFGDASSRRRRPLETDQSTDPFEPEVTSAPPPEENAIASSVPPWAADQRRAPLRGSQTSICPRTAPL